MSARAELEAWLRTLALTYPEAHEDFPWGERVVKVRGKIFCFLWGNDDHVGFTVKLPASHEFARMMGAEPTGYGLGRSGWVTLRLGDGDAPDRDLLAGWLDESYRAVAPKGLVKLL
jgi:predicted DNA-binding protein (MmcQ/YjbR family)